MDISEFVDFCFIDNHCGVPENNWSELFILILGIDGLFISIGRQVEIPQISIEMWM